MNKLSRNELSEIVLSDNKKVHDKFLSTFSVEVNSFIDGLVRVFDYLAELDNKMPKEERAAWVQMFLFSSFNSLLTSFHLLISGFLNARWKSDEKLVRSFSYGPSLLSFSDRHFQ